MTPLCRQSLIEQTARHLRDMIDAGHWGREMPGALLLARSCSVSRDTALAALQLLEKEGTLYPGGSGKNRVIRRRRRPGRRARALRVAVLLDEPLPTNNAHSQELILSIKNAIEAEGHVCDLCDKAMNQMGTLRQLARFARSMAADAWIVYSGSREVLTWFAQKQVPVLAIGGRALGLPIASTYTDISRAMAAAVDAFVEKGHRRIVLICPGFWRSPIPGPSTQAFLERLRHHGIKVSDFNLPAWKETPEGFETMLNSLFRITPPTALVTIEPAYCVAARILLAERGVLVPRDLSLVSILPDPAFSLLRQPIAHFDWTIPALVGRATDWIKAVARGVTDHEVRFFHAKFQPGGTIAAARREQPSS